MTIYALFAIWTLSPIVCACILRRRQLTFGPRWALFSGFLGPIVIPVAFWLKAENSA